MARVLIVDDESHVRRILQMTLVKNGFEVDVAYDGQAGIERVREQMPDFMVVDIEMPRMNGIEMCQQLYQEYPEAECRIFVASSRAESEFRDWTDQYANVSFLEKPVSMKQLLVNLSEK